MHQLQPRQNIRTSATDRTWLQNRSAAYHQLTRSCPRQPQSRRVRAHNVRPMVINVMTETRDRRQRMGRANHGEAVVGPLAMPGGQTTSDTGLQGMEQQGDGI